MTIEWRPVRGLEGRYEVSNTGLVRSLKNSYGKERVLVLSQRLDGKGYPQVRLYTGSNGESVYPKVHRLVASHFLVNENNLATVNHIDEVKTNNNVSNLEWMSNEDNVAYSCAKSYKFTSPNGDLVVIHNLRKFCKDNNLTDANMNKVNSGERKQHKGWTKWEE
ncbi:HNH endonuclease [Vibrio phage D529]